MMQNYWAREEEWERFMDLQYAEAYGMMEDQRLAFEKEIEALKQENRKALAEQRNYLVTKIDQFLTHKADDFYKALVVGDVKAIARLRQVTQSIAKTETT